MRLFAAILLNEEVKADLVRMQDALRDMGVRGNYTRPENMHVTLAFIGEYDDPSRAAVAVRAAAPEPFDITLSGAGAFRSVWWAGLHGEGMDSCARQLRQALQAAGVPFDHAAFKPHITLLRRPQLPPGLTQEQALAAISKLGQASMTVERISLMRSDRTDRGVKYTEIG